jgi:membrane protein YdbS with pleckstrin-like domain
MSELTPDRPRSQADLARVHSMQRPHPNLMRYYALAGLLAGPIYPILVIVLYFRYRTLWYRFDPDGVRMGWGILFRREVSLAYARIQDIHLSSNLVERWLGLARIQVSTASGSASAEMTVEGLPEYELVRDFLYSRMRGAEAPAGPVAVHPTAPQSHELVTVLRQVSADLRAVRAALEGRSAK